jgi:hypothetical protein
VLQEKKYSVHEGTSKRYHHLAQFPNKLMSSVVNIKKRGTNQGVFGNKTFLMFCDKTMALKNIIVFFSRKLFDKHVKNSVLNTMI